MKTVEDNRDRSEGTESIKRRWQELTDPNEWPDGRISEVPEAVQSPFPPQGSEDTKRRK